jgi:hypothetical protein
MKDKTFVEELKLLCEKHKINLIKTFDNSGHKVLQDDSKHNVLIRIFEEWENDRL